MNPDLFLNYPIVERQRLLKEYGNSDFIYKLLEKHLKTSVSRLKTMYQLEYSIVTGKLTISGSETDIFKLFSYFQSFGLQISTISSRSLTIDGNYLLTIIY